MSRDTRMGSRLARQSPSWNPANPGWDWSLLVELCDECPLLWSLDGIATVSRPNPVNRLASGEAAQDGEASQGCSGTPVTADAPHLHTLPYMRLRKH